jgi:hypothetical protein
MYAVALTALALAAAVPMGAAPAGEGTTSSSTPLSASPSSAEAVAAWVEEMAAAERALTDLTAVLKKRERKGGRLLEEHVIELKVRKPFAVYAKWRGPAHRGRELVFRRGWNGDRMRVKDGLLTVDLDPHGWLALRGERHPITHVGFGYTVARIVDDTRRARDLRDREQRYELLGQRRIEGRLARCWRSRLPKERDDRFYAHAAEVCQDLETRLPVLVKSFLVEGGALRLVEDYRYADVRVDPGLDARDFDPANPAYGF